MSMLSAFSSAIQSGLNISEARAIIKEGLATALSTMQNMIGNPGQQTVYNDYVIPQFKENAQGDIEDGWEDVDIGEYMDFMAEIVNEGNGIMAEAYQAAQDILSEAEEELLDSENG